MEINDDPVSGAIVDWGERVRFRHIISRRYLSAPYAGSYQPVIILSHRHRKRSDGKVVFTLIPEPDATAVFIMDPVVADDKFVRFDTYARIQHVLTGTGIEMYLDQTQLLLGSWIHGSKDRIIKRADHRKSFLSPEKFTKRASFEGIQWYGCLAACYQSHC